MSGMPKDSDYVGESVLTIDKPNQKVMKTLSIKILVLFFISTSFSVAQFDMPQDLSDQMPSAWNIDKEIVKPTQSLKVVHSNDQPTFEVDNSFNPHIYLVKKNIMMEIESIVRADALYFLNAKAGELSETNALKDFPGMNQVAFAQTYSNYEMSLIPLIRLKIK